MKYVTVSHELNKAVRDKMEETLNKCRSHYGKTIPTPPLQFKQLGRTAGKCRFVYGCWMNNNTSSATILINPDFFKNHYDDMLHDTVPHEVAHYVALFLYGKEGDGHGWRWREVMAIIGLAASTRCHEYSLEGVKAKPMPFKYTCGCSKEHNLSKTMHQRHQSALSAGRKGYKCRVCKKPLTYQGFTHNGNFIPSEKKDTPTKAVEVARIIPANLLPKISVVIQPKPIVVEKPDSGFRTITRFVNGSLTNVRVPVSLAA